MKVKLELPSTNALIHRKGLDKGGAVQQFHTQNVMRRIQRYMPYRSGATIKLMIAQTVVDQPEIIIDTPYARFLYYEKLMVDPKTGAAGFLTSNGWRSRKGVPKVLSNRPITYTTTKNPLAGPFWDRALVAREGKALVQDLQNYIDRKG